MKPYLQSHTASKALVVEQPKKGNDSIVCIENVNNEPVVSNATTNPHELQRSLDEHDYGIREAVTKCFMEQAETKNAEYSNSEYSAIVVEDADENYGNPMYEGNDDGPFVKSEVVTHQEQRTQHLVIQAIDGGMQYGFCEEVVTTTTTTKESRSGSSDRDTVTPAKWNVEKNPGKKYSPKRRSSTGDCLAQADSSSKPPTKRRYSMAERKAYDVAEEKRPRVQKPSDDGRLKQTKSTSKDRPKRRASMVDRGTRRGNEIIKMLKK